MIRRAPLSLLLLAGLLCAGCEPAPEAPVVAPGPAEVALAERAEQVAEAARGTPGQEPINMVMGKGTWVNNLYRRLTGEEPATAAQLAHAVARVEPLVEQAERGAEMGRLPAIELPRVQKAPAIDGVLEDAAWKTAARFAGLYPFGTLAKDAEAPATTWLACWDETHLYFAFDCADADVVAPPLERDGQVWRHDCVEMFICPVVETGVYWEIVVSPTGVVFDALHSKQVRKWGPGTSRLFLDVEGLEVGHKVRGTANRREDTDEGYRVEVAVPFRALPQYRHGGPAAGQTLNFMLVRLDGTGKELAAYGFQPILSWGHNIWNHAPVTLTE